MPPRNSNAPYWLQAENAKWIMKYPAMTVMVFMRKDIGYRLLNPPHMLCMTGLLAFVALMIPPKTPDANPECLLWFAIVSLFLGSCQRTKRWKEFKRGVLQHSYYVGTSPFDFQWLPRPCRRFRRVARFVDPFFCIIVGLFCLPVSTVLGFWLMIAGAALRVYEDAVHRKELNRDLDILDSLVTSEIHGQTVERFDEKPAAQPGHSKTGVPTGLASDVRDQIKRRKTK